MQDVSRERTDRTLTSIGCGYERNRYIKDDCQVLTLTSWVVDDAIE